MIPRPEQLDCAEQAYAILKKHMLVYLAMEERTGKTLTSLLVCERCENVKSVLVITKKNALSGWHNTLADWEHTKSYEVTNYHQVHKFKHDDYDLVILDEAHNYISGFPKRSLFWKRVKKLTIKRPLIYLSATPHAQGLQMLYNPLALSSWSPFREWQSPYRWFEAFGIPKKIMVHDRLVETYKRVKTRDVERLTQHLFITATRKELGFTHEPTDKLHYIQLDDTVKEHYNTLLKKKVLDINEDKLICDTPMKLRTSLHMMEGGVAKVGEKYLVLPNEEKIQYILKTWGDTPSLVIMYNYIAEGKKLHNRFQFARILQATSFAEGIDLADWQTLVIYSQDFSTARHTQRRARQSSKSRTEPITVHYLLVHGGISEQVYKTVSINKRNFVDSVFERTPL